MNATRFLVLITGCVLLTLALFSPASPQETALDALVDRLQSSLAAKDQAAYLDLFVPELREQEKSFLDDIFVHYAMNGVSLHRSGSPGPVDISAPVYVQGFFENSFSALEETWQISLAASDGRWLIKKKEIVGDITSLYRMVMPNGRAERVDRVEISHQDIRLTFTDAVVFYDNIPELETGLIILGKGRLLYTPSVEAEQHQLEMTYGQSGLNEGLEFVYLRFSPSFFKGHIRIEKSAGTRTEPVSPADIKRAYSIFARDYPRSFTVENPLNDELYSVLPQSEEAVFEFRTDSGRELTYINSPFAPEEIHLIDRHDDRLVNLYSPREEPGQRRMLVSLGPKFDIQNYSLDADFTPSTKYFSVKARMEILSKSDHLSSLKLVLNSALEIVHLYDGAGRELFYTQDRLRNLLYIYLIEPAGRDTTFTLEVYYRGQLPPVQAATDVLALPQESTAFSLMPIIYDTHFYTNSSHWYPAPQEEDYFTARLRLIVPPEYTCVANGLLQSRGLLNDVRSVESIEKVGRLIFTFEIRSPVKYLSFIAGRFERADSASTGLAGSLFLTPSIYLHSSGTWDMCREVLGFYEDYFGGFPFEKLDIVQRLSPTGGGSSPASFIVLNELPRTRDARVILNPRSPVDFSRWKEYFPSHEIAHQWWGQAISWDTYHDQWLSEGLAQLSSFLYLRERYGDKDFLTILKKLCQWTKKDSVWGAITLGSRLSFLNFEAFQAVVYDKSALVLLMLRDILGPETFRAGLREFYGTFQYHAARTAQFFQVMTRVSGRDLDRFLKGWFDSYALPKVRLTWSATESNGRPLLRLSLDQIKDVFVFPLTVQWKENGQTVRRMIVVDQKTQSFEFELKGKPQKITADPDGIFPGSIEVGR